MGGGAEDADGGEVVLGHDFKHAEDAEDGIAFDHDGADSEADLGLNLAHGAGDGFKLAAVRQRVYGAKVEQDVEEIGTSGVGSQLLEMRHHLRESDVSGTLRANQPLVGVNQVSHHG